MILRRTRRMGFSLIETVVATLILSASVVALGAISTNVLHESRLNQHYATAASVVERQLALIDAAGIDQFIEKDQTEGVFEEAPPGYRWHVETQYQSIDDLYLVSITVEWLEGTRPYRVVVQTMLDGANGTNLPTTPSSDQSTQPGQPAQPASGGGPS
jgi:type II secretory pathway pseudopilin PulG